MEIYCGKQPDGPYQLENSGAEVVKRLIEPSDNWFTSIPLAESLIRNYNLTFVRTIRKNKPEIPPTFINTKNKEVNSSNFGFSNSGVTLVSYVPKKAKVVPLISTLHNDKAIDVNSGPLKKPEIITFYNMTKAGVDVLDQLSETYSVARKCNRWPLVFFFSPTKHIWYKFSNNLLL